MRRSLLSLASLGLATTALLTANGPTAQAAETYSAPLQTAIGAIPVATEDRTGYSRDEFRHWVDADGDGCDTRKEILISEADDPVTVGASCALTGGRWFSYYDRVSWTDQGRIDIDHMVPLAEAWDSGASGLDRRTTRGLRQRPRRLPQPRRRHRLGQPVQGRPGPDHLDADLRQVPLPRRLGGGQDPLAVEHRQRGEVCTRLPRLGLLQRDDHRRSGALRRRCDRRVGSRHDPT